MSILKQVKNKLIYEEFSKSDQDYWFNLKEKAFLSHIDTLYYSIFLKNDSVEDVPVNIIEFVNVLKDCKVRFEEEKRQAFYFDQDEDLLFTGKRNKIYDYCLSVPGMWDIFICSSLPNIFTPRIHIQLRSNALWGLGELNSIVSSYNCILKQLSLLNIEVDKVQENRIDYCYHTNYIQNQEAYFSDDMLKQHLDTNLRIYSKTGRFSKGELTIEYLSLGNRKSNNLFFRTYNKSREVVEMAYKGFFFDVWKSNGLISEYDYFIYSDCYKRQRYDSIEKSMILFYINYGQDKNLVARYKDMLDKDISVVEIRKEIKGVLPYPTLIMNIEYQTMRKFYFNAEEMINALPLISNINDDNLVRLFQIIDNRNVFLNYLTSTTVSFKKNVNNVNNDLKEKELYTDLWYRLRKCKLDGFTADDLQRVYNRRIDKDLLLRRLKGCLATLSLYENKDMTDINEDLSCLLSVLNDNDNVVDENGEIKINDIEYIRIKDKKKKALNSIIKKYQTRPLNR